MAETISGRGLRGLSNALNLQGEREAPPGIELELPAQTVHDLTPYVRYGSAHVFGQSSDGWVLAVVKDVTVGAEFSSQTIGDWRNQIESGFDLSPGRLERMNLWVYGCTVDVVAQTSLDDIGAVSLDFEVSFAIARNSPTIVQYSVFASDGQAAHRVLKAGPLNVILANQLDTRWPVVWPGGRSGRFRCQGVNAVNTVTFTWLLLCRMIPMGQAPLP